MTKAEINRSLLAQGGHSLSLSFLSLLYYSQLSFCSTLTKRLNFIYEGKKITPPLPTSLFFPSPRPLPTLSSLLLSYSTAQSLQHNFKNTLRLSTIQRFTKEGERRNKPRHLLRGLHTFPLLPIRFQHLLYHPQIIVKLCLDDLDLEWTDSSSLHRLFPSTSLDYAFRFDPSNCSFWVP